MKVLHKISLFFFFGMVLLSSCAKQNIDEIVPEKPDFQPEIVIVNELFSALKTNTTAGADLNCITLKYPFEMLLKSGAVATIQSADELNTVMDQNALDGAVDFVFPISFSDNSGAAHMAQNNRELGLNFASCVPTTGWTSSASSQETLPAFLLENLCYNLAYPLNLEDDQGNTYVAINEEEFIALCATVEPLFFTLPFVVVDSDGLEIMVTDMENFFNLVYQCEGISPPVSNDTIQITGFGCNTLAYPFSVQLEDGSIIEINDEDEYAALVLSGAMMQLQFPFSLENDSVGLVIINEFLDVIEALAYCGITIEIGPVDVCETPVHILLFFNTGPTPNGCGYEINYPLQVVAEEVTYDINDMTQYFSVYNMYATSIDKIEMVYPFSVNLIDGGSDLEFNEDSEFCSFISECE